MVSNSYKFLRCVENKKMNENSLEPAGLPPDVFNDI